jgi:hypothetical protein
VTMKRFMAVSSDLSLPLVGCQHQASPGMAEHASECFRQPLSAPAAGRRRATRHARRAAPARSRHRPPRAARPSRRTGIGRAHGPARSRGRRSRLPEARRGRFGRRAPGLATRCPSGSRTGPCRRRSSVETRSLPRSEPSMRQPRAGPGRRLVVQFGVALPNGLRRAVRRRPPPKHSAGSSSTPCASNSYRSSRAIARRSAERWASPPPASRACVTPCSRASARRPGCRVRPSASKIGPNSLDDSGSRARTTCRPIGNALRVVGVEQRRRGLPLQHHQRASR